MLSRSGTVFVHDRPSQPSPWRGDAERSLRPRNRSSGLSIGESVAKAGAMRFSKYVGHNPYTAAGSIRRVINRIPTKVRMVSRTPRGERSDPSWSAVGSRPRVWLPLSEKSPGKCAETASRRGARGTGIRRSRCTQKTHATRATTVNSGLLWSVENADRAAAVCKSAGRGVGRRQLACLLPR